MIKVAVPTRGSQVDDHFGHCELYTIYTLDVKDKAVIETETLPSPEGCGCKSNIASILKDKNVSVMLAGNMGAGAMNVLNSNGIEVIRGCNGPVKDVVDAFIEGVVADSGVGCEHHSCN